MGHHYSVCWNCQESLFWFKTTGNLFALLYGRCCHGLTLPGPFMEPVPGPVRCCQNAGTHWIYPFVGSTPTWIGCIIGKNLFASWLDDPHFIIGRISGYSKNWSIWTGLCFVPNHLWCWKTTLSHGPGWCFRNHCSGWIQRRKTKIVEMAGFFHWRGDWTGLWQCLYPCTGSVRSNIHRTGQVDPDTLGGAYPAHRRYPSHGGHRYPAGPWSGLFRYGTALLGCHWWLDWPFDYRGHKSCSLS